MELTIEQSCPGCGAPIELQEDDRLVRCSFCEVNNYMLDQGGRRFVLPWSLPHDIDEQDLFFVPYLRFKGAVLYVSGYELKHKLIDTTRLGLENFKFPVSMRLRPQVMKVKPVVAGMKGRFLDQTVKIETLFSNAVKIASLFSKKKNSKLYHRAFIGESLSRIYQPCYIRENKIFDAIDNRLLCPAASLEHLEEKSSESNRSWEPKFITTICPGCGGFLEGESDSLVLYCCNCETLWQEE
ncbi:MAG: hypothetical protein KAI39_10065, partial [Desulfobulbaceae bacterium]|nr:hypothetical protein [Desulfobulbaceae bacterium]